MFGSQPPLSRQRRLPRAQRQEPGGAQTAIQYIRARSHLRVDKLIQHRTRFLLVSYVLGSTGRNGGGNTLPNGESVPRGTREEQIPWFNCQGDSHNCSQTALTSVVTSSGESPAGQTHLATSRVLCRSSAVMLSGSFLRISTKSSSTAYKHSAITWQESLLWVFKVLNTITTLRLQEKRFNWRNISTHCYWEASPSEIRLVLIFEKNSFLKWVLQSRVCVKYVLKSSGVLILKGTFRTRKCFCSLFRKLQWES